MIFFDSSFVSLDARNLYNALLNCLPYEVLLALWRVYTGFKSKLWPWVSLLLKWALINIHCDCVSV
jgi:hypothetical protein